MIKSNYYNPLKMRLLFKKKECFKDIFFDTSLSCQPKNKDKKIFI